MGGSPLLLAFGAAAGLPVSEEVNGTSHARLAVSRTRLDLPKLRRIRDTELQWYAGAVA